MTEYLSIAQVAARSGVTERAVRGWIQEGLKLLRVNKRVLRISTDDLDEFMRRNEPRVKGIEVCREQWEPGSRSNTGSEARRDRGTNQGMTERPHLETVTGRRDGQKAVPEKVRRFRA